MSNGRRWSVSLGRRLLATAITFVALFVICAGAGLANWAVAALGIALVVLAVSILVVSAVRGNARSFVRGTAHVLDATDPPANTPYGRCELQIVVEAPELAPAKVKIRDTRVPVAKWPDIGDTLPIRVAIEDPRHVRILWDEVRTHGEEAAEDKRFNEYVQRIVDAGLSGSGPDVLDAGAAAGGASNGHTLDEGAIPPVPGSGPPPSEAAPSDAAPSDAVAPPAASSPATPSPVPRQKPSPRRRRPSGSVATPAAAAAMATSATAVATPLPARPAAERATAESDAPRPATAGPAELTEPDELSEPDELTELDELTEQDEEPIHDIVPIEGASAVLGVSPSAAGDPASATVADAEAVRDLLAALPAARPGAAGAFQGVGVTLIVTDLARTIDFYRDKLGFHLMDSGPNSAVLASGDTRLMVRCVPDMPRVDRRVVHLNLEVGDIEAVYAELQAKGVRFIHRPRAVARGEHMELWAAAFRDPDGHGIALIKWQQVPA